MVSILPSRNVLSSLQHEEVRLPSDLLDPSFILSSHQSPHMIEIHVISVLQ